MKNQARPNARRLSGGLLFVGVVLYVVWMEYAGAVIIILAACYWSVGLILIGWDYLTRLWRK